MRRRGPLAHGVASIAAALLAAGCAGSGRAEQRYPTGELRMEVPTRGGDPHGQAVLYRRDGSVESRGPYVHGQRHGLFEVLDPAGATVRREIYVRDRLAWSSSEPGAEVPPSLAFAVQGAADEGMLAPLIDRDYLDAPPAFALAEPLHGTSGGDVRLDLVLPLPDGTSGRRLLAGLEWWPGEVGAYGRLVTSEWGGDKASHRLGKTLVEAGAVLRRRLPLDHLALIRLGAFVPVANDDLESFEVERAAPYSLVRDTAYHLPRVIGLRSSGSLIRRLGPLFGRLDVGLDLAGSVAGEDDPARLDGSDVVVRSAAGAGLMIGDLIVAAELAAAGTGQGAVEPPVTGAVSLHVPSGTWQLIAAVSVALSGDGLAFSLGFSQRARPARAAPPSPRAALASHAR